MKNQNTAGIRRILMYKCDKCGCEHTSRTVCPKCGALVIIVNEDYLLRRQQWEEQQKNNLRYKKKGERENSKAGWNFPSGISGDNTNDFSSAGGRNTGSESGRKRNEGSDSSGSSDINLKDKIIDIKNTILTAIRNKKSVSDEEKRKKERENNAAALKDNRREQKLKKRRKKLIMSVSVAAGIIVAAAGVTAGIKIYKSIDRSDLRYFDGHALLSVDNGVLLNLNRDDADYSLLTYTEGLNAALLKDTAAGMSLIGWYDGREYKLMSDIGYITDEYMLSESGRYLAYVLYSEDDEKYFLVIYDLSDGKNVFYDTDRRIKLVAVNEAGRVLFNEIDTGDYSTVVGIDFYAADLSKRLMIAGNASDTGYDKDSDEAVFIKDRSLYACAVSKNVIDKYEDIISDKEHIFVNEGVDAIVQNILGKAVLYITDEKLWIYENGQSYPAVENTDTSDEFYYDGDMNLYYRAKDKLYYVEQNCSADVKTDTKNKSSISRQQEDLEAMEAGTAVMVLENISGDIVADDDGSLWCVNDGGTLFKVSKSDVNEIDTGVRACVKILGLGGCAYYKESRIVFCYGKGGKNKLVYEDTGVNMISGFDAAKSKKFLYYVDQSSILWKIAKNGKTKESLGFASLIGIFDNK